MRDTLKLWLVVLIVARCAPAFSADIEECALRVLTGVSVGLDNAFIDANGDGQRDGTTAGLSMEQIRAVTNRADVLALAAQMDEEATRPRTDPTGVHIPATGLLVIDSDTGKGYAVDVDDAGVIDAYGPVHGSPWSNATERAAMRTARRAERQAIRDGFRAEIEDSKTNRADCVALVAAQTNGIAQMQALTIGNTYNRNQIIALRDAMVADAQRQRDIVAELRQSNAELLDAIRLLRRQLMDTRPEATPQ